MIINSQFTPAWWLRNRHAQTIWQTLFRKAGTIALERERFELDDGDFLDIDKTQDNGGNIVLILHGLEGGLHSSYAIGMLKTLQTNGFFPILMYHRSCSEEINRLACSYHSGFIDDAGFTTAILRKRYPKRKIVIIGYSLGGSILLNLLAKGTAKTLPDLGIAVSVPLSLKISANQLNKGFSRLYRNHFIKTMRLKLKAKQHLSKIQALDLSAINNSQDFNVFDHEYTARVNGYNSGDDYYTQASTRDQLKEITTPTLIIHAKDDPFMTDDIIPDTSELSEQVTFELSRYGGHVGFISGNIPGYAEYWLEKRVIEYIQMAL